jgi:hypothetical protein
MSKDLNGLADELLEETLSEAAGTFFGKRKKLEDAIDLLQNKIETLKRMEVEVVMRAGDLHYLLLKGQAVKEFYSALGVDPGLLPEVADLEIRAGRVHKHKALTTGGRYFKMVADAYKRMRDAADIYMNGSYVTDKEGKKRQTLNYGQIKGWCKELNEQIEKLNRESSPSEVLAFVKKLDVEAEEKANIAGAGGSINGSIDEDMAFEVLDCTGIDLTEIPDMPALEKVQSQIKAFCKSIASEHKERVAELMESVDSIEMK